MSSSSTSANFFAKLGLSSSSNSTSVSCSHGYGIQENQSEYPCNAKSKYILERILYHITNHGHFKRAVEMLILQDLFGLGEPNESDVKSCIMIGTDLLCCSTNSEDKQAQAASYMATAVLASEEFLGSVSLTEFQDKVTGALLNLDNMQSVVRFFDERNFCSCLKHAKKVSKKEIGRCERIGCTTVCLESKLKKCGGCKVTKYCGKECQKADWSAHKTFCKETQKLNNYR